MKKYFPVLAACTAVFALSAPVPVLAATMRAGGTTQIIISGPFVPGDIEQFKTLLKDNPDINAVILYDSPGGDGTVMQGLSAIIRGRKLSTGVAGNCASACAMIFLSGVQRYFTDLVPTSDTSLGFHGSYESGGALAPESRLQMIKGMIRKETGGKADTALVDRWTHFYPRNHFMRFAYPGKDGLPKGPTVFECDGSQRGPTDYAPCQPIPGKDALSMGIITSTQLLQVEP
jgi:hypothetical protein